MLKCAPCEAAAAANNMGIQRQSERQLTTEQMLPNEECGYTLSLLTSWKLKLETVLQEGKQDLIFLTGVKIRSYIGYTQSAINYPSNFCFYSPFLAPIVQVINNIDAL